MLRLRALLLFVFLQQENQAQSIESDTSIRFFSTYQSNRVQEKIFVHTDKESYLQGEVMWFKVYDLQETDYQFSGLSRVAYVEVLGVDHVPLLQAKVSLKNGTGNGSFLIPASVSSANYLLRAYTAWMKNFSADYFFQKPLTIINTRKRPDWAALDRGDQIDLDFFPEGGQLVEALQSRVAFHLQDAYGHGLHGKGAVLDENRDTVLVFEPVKFGIGSFRFTPRKGHSYKAVCILDDRRIVSKDLPVVVQGSVLEVKEEGRDQLAVTLSSNLAGSSFFLLVHHKKQIDGEWKQDLKQGKAVWLIPKLQLGTGLIHFTVFNESNQPVAERLYCIPPPEMTIELRPDHNEYPARSKLELEITTWDLPGQSLSADLSLSVIRIDSIQQVEEMSIGNYLSLGSECQGRIEAPGYYFQKNDEGRKALDDLMLSQETKRFSWQQLWVNKDSELKWLPEYEGHIISGRVTNIKTGQPAPGIAAYLSVPGIRFHFSNAVSDTNGRIHFLIKDFYGLNELVVQTNRLKDSIYRIELDDPFSDQYSSYRLPRFELSPDLKNQLAYRSRYAQLQSAFYREEEEQFALPEMDTLAFYGQPDKKYFLDDYTRFRSMEEVIHEYVFRVHLRKEGGDYHLELDNIPYQDRFHEAPLVLLDGVPVFDINKVIALDPLKLKKMEVVGRRYFYGNMVNQGILGLSTYEGDLSGFELDPNSLVMEYEGLQLERIFQAPSYEGAQGNHLPDYRNVLCWMPDVHTNGKTKISLYTSDLPGTYAIVVQGISSSGIAGSKVITITVK